MALWSQTSARLVDAMETDIQPRVATTTLKNKVFHADIQIQSIEDASRRRSEASDDSRVIEDRRSSTEDEIFKKRAEDMQMWWHDAITRNMDLPDGYLKVAVLLIKWKDELDELNTREEAEELEAVFHDKFHFETKTVELDVSSKPQFQMNEHLSRFVRQHDGPKTLLIVYYTGHGVYQEDHKYLELTASLQSTVKKGLNKDARCNWDKAEEILRSEDLESDVLTILDTCYSSNLAKSGKEETRIMELLSACAIDSTTAAPGENSFTRALIDALEALLDQFNGRAFNTIHLNQRILLDQRRRDTPSQLWYRLQHHGRHISLAPLKPERERKRVSPALNQLPKGFLTLRFALRDDSLNEQQIEYLTRNLSKAFHRKALVGLMGIDWLGIKPARITHFGRAALAMFAIAQWKKFVNRRREEKREQLLAQRRLDEVNFPIPSVEESPSSSPTRKRARDGFDGLPEPDAKREYLVIPQPPSPPVSDSSRIEEIVSETVGA